MYIHMFLSLYYVYIRLSIYSRIFSSLSLSFMYIHFFLYVYTHRLCVYKLYVDTPLFFYVYTHLWFMCIHICFSLFLSLSLSPYLSLSLFLSLSLSLSLFLSLSLSLSLSLFLSLSLSLSLSCLFPSLSTCMCRKGLLAVTVKVNPLYICQSTVYMSIHYI